MISSNSRELVCNSVKYFVLALLVPTLVFGNLTIWMWASVFYFVCPMVVLRLDFGELDEQPEVFWGFACWIMLFAVEVCSLLKICVWYDFIISEAVVLVYYAIKAKVKGAKIDGKNWIKNAIITISVGYASLLLFSLLF